MKKIGSASVLSFMDEMEKISNQMGFDFGGPPQAVQTAMGAAQIPVRAAQKYIPAMARQYGTRFANWAKRQPGEIKQGLGHGVEALKNPMQAVQGGFEHKVAPLKNLANNPLTLGNAVSAGLTAHGLMQSGKQMVNAVKDKEDPTGQGKSRIARGIEARRRRARGLS